MTTPFAFELAAILFGLLLGSFLNVCISRLPAHESIRTPRSHCPQCGHPIRWYDNLPLVSWLLLRGRCRDCGKRISGRYPAVELAVGAWFGAVIWIVHSLIGLAIVGGLTSQIEVDFITKSFGLMALGFLLIGLLVMDWQTHLLPDVFTLTGILLGFVLVFVRAAFLEPGQLDIHFDPQKSARLSSPGSFVAKGDVFMTGPERLVLGRLLAIVAAGCLVLLIRFAYQKLRGREGLGLGDAKLVAMIAAFLGFWPAMLALFIGVVACAMYAVTLIARRRADRLTRLPLGSFLSIGGLIAALLGPTLIGWYTNFL